MDIFAKFSAYIKNSRPEANEGKKTDWISTVELPPSPPKQPQRQNKNKDPKNPIMTVIINEYFGVHTFPLSIKNQHSQLVRDWW